MADMAVIEAESAWAAQERARELHRPADSLIQSIYEKRVAWSALPGAYDRKVRSIYACLRNDPPAAAAWHALLQTFTGTDLLSIEPVVPYLGPQAGNTFLDALFQLALRQDHWLRPLEDWEREPGEPRSQFASLTRYLLTCYQVPAFLDAAWFEGFTEEGHLHRNWFVHIGTGENVRTGGGPTHLTKMAAHHFLEAPDDFPIVWAVRWGQTIGLGGEEVMARAFATSRLGGILPDEPFWESVIHFFVNHPHMDRGQIGPIVDYIFYQRFGDPADRLEPPEPDFTMKGRTLPALLKRMESWHEQLARDSKRPRTSWEPTGIPEFHLEERDQFGTLNTWAVVELLNSRALMEEGREQHHCVFSYAPMCHRGTTSIWSLRVRSSGEGRMRRLLTIEVDNTKRAIVQVRGRCNKTLGSLRGGRMKVAGEVLRRWAREARLSIHCGM